jgi:transmembrane sensor
MYSSKRERKRWIAILKKYQSGHASPQEVLFVEKYLHYLEKQPDILNELPESERVALQSEMRDGLRAVIHRQPDMPAAAVRRVHFPISRWAAAAILVLLLGSGWLYFLHRSRSPELASQGRHFKSDVAPGRSGAVLTLSNGQKIVLDSAGDGELARDASVAVIKKNGTIAYQGRTAETVYNTITTNRGRQWQLTLPDGTQVWLNAASSIQYPISFTGKERSVAVTGEGYFEVKHNAAQPFRVRVGNQVIEDVGTGFNVNAYPDEPIIQTTLVEGKVRVSAQDTGTHDPAWHVVLSPGQQAQVNAAGKVHVVSDADVEQATAWKNGLFSFEHASLPVMMRQLARWYNVDVQYKGDIPNHLSFTGEMGRDLSLAQVLHLLASMHVHFTIEEDKRVVIVP